MQTTHTLLELAKGIAARPQMWALTPEMAVGKLEGIAYAILLSLEGQTLDSSLRIVHRMLKEAMNISETSSTGPLLCDETLTSRTSSFDAFRENSRRFLLLLEQRVEELSAG